MIQILLISLLGWSDLRCQDSFRTFSAEKYLNQKLGVQQMTELLTDLQLSSEIKNILINTEFIEIGAGKLVKPISILPRSWFEQSYAQAYRNYWLIGKIKARVTWNPSVFKTETDLAKGIIEFLYQTHKAQLLSVNFLDRLAIYGRTPINFKQTLMIHKSFIIARENVLLSLKQNLSKHPQNALSVVVNAARAISTLDWMFLKLSYDGVLVSMIQNESLTYKWTQGSFRTLGWIYRHFKNFSYATVTFVSLQAISDWENVSKMIDGVLKQQNQLQWTQAQTLEFQTQLGHQIAENPNLTPQEKAFFKKLMDTDSGSDVQ
jgi:hypothetical protein